MGVARALPILVLLSAALAPAKEADGFRRQMGEVEVDWSTGTLTAQGGAAADLRMPHVNAARPGAERRARAAAEEKLRAALREIARGKPVDDKTVLARASVSRVEYQSSGGVVLWLTLAFADLAPAKPTDISLQVASMPFALAPIMASGGKTSAVGVATYRPAADCPKGALRVERDAQGRLVLPAAAAPSFDSLAGAAVVIYLERPQP
jgi:hypothetical protein